MEYPPQIPFIEYYDQEKFQELDKQYKLEYSNLPQFYIRVPGRVNLIGEHVDYNGFAVLPMAIEQDIIMAIGNNTDQCINISNVESETYESHSFAVKKDIEIDNTTPKWYNYLLCGIKAVADKFVFNIFGFNILVEGIIPPASGLSSSSALVSAAALATTMAIGIPIPKNELAARCAEYEKYIGTQGGGMDQAIQFFAEPGTAKLIEFNPLKSADVYLPTNVAFVVCHSGITCNKATSKNFNYRVAECRLAARMLGYCYEYSVREVKTLYDMAMRLDLPEMPKVVQRTLHRYPYTRKEICTKLCLTDSEFEALLPKNSADLELYNLRGRALHVYEEALRVLKFKEICEEGSASGIYKLGKLMNESHKSCRENFECSHPRLDELVQICLESGAFGSRLTGAGWGGCCISLILERDAEDFMKKVMRRYYYRECFRNTPLEKLMFLSKSSGCACIYVK